MSQCREEALIIHLFRKLFEERCRRDQLSSVRRATHYECWIDSFFQSVEDFGRDFEIAVAQGLVCQVGLCFVVTFDREVF